MYARDFTLIATPIGMVRVTADAGVIHSISIEPVAALAVAPVHIDPVLVVPVLVDAAQQLSEWFAGTRTLFTLPLAATATARGQALRDAMIAIPFGTTTSYGALSRAIGSSPRAIGQACARNPLPIIVPCHRVLNAGGGLGAYSAGDGPQTKNWLLDHERHHARTTLL